MKKAWLKIVSLVLVISMLLTALPTTTFAKGSEYGEIYIRSVQLARAKTKEEARRVLEEAHKKAQSMVAQEAVYQEAQKQAQELLDAAKQKIEELKKVSNQFMAESLKETEAAVAAALKNVQATRAKFDSMVSPPKKVETPNRNNPFVDIDL